MKSESKMLISDSVVSRDVAGEIMLIDLERGTYFGLDAVGARIWKLLEAGNGIVDLCKTLEREFDVPPAQLRSDVEKLLEDFVKFNIVSSAEK